MTQSVSIPERAREIAERHGLGWDGDKEWIHDTRVIAALTEMARSERELLAQQAGEFWRGAANGKKFAEWLREGGQK